MDNLTIYINNEVVLEFRRDYHIDDEQLAFLDRMDANMDKGIKIYGELLENPNSRQRATFVTMNLIKALQQDNQAIQTASCVYLINRMPELIEVHAKNSDNKIIIELIEK